MGHDEPFDDEGETPVTPTLRPLTHAERLDAYGKFRFLPAPTAADKERIVILDSWVEEHITTVVVPELGNRQVRVHKLVADQFLRLFTLWAAAGVITRIRTWDGAFDPRYKPRRAWGGPENLSSRAWGIAFALNARWNRLDEDPAAVGAEGSVRELVSIARESGWWWGGDFDVPYRHGAHFEVAKTLVLK